MSEAEQSRKPQQDKPTDSGAALPESDGRASGEPEGDAGADARTRPGVGGGAADAGTDAVAGSGVEPGDGTPERAGERKAARGGSGARAALPRQTTGGESVSVGAGQREEAAGAAASGGAGPGRDTAGRASRSARGSGAKGDPEGRLLSGRYRLGGVLGRGGMGTVWRAVDETLGRTVAVKELRFPNSIDDEEKRRLITRTLREAKAIARIRNNSAVTVFDVVDEDDRPWIVMELVEGKSLAEVIREDGTLTPRRAAEVGLAVLDVLRSAHREGILHRDVKPSNVLIADDGRVVLTDFGIAQVEGDPSITSTGMLVGAPSYISPERARGHRPGPAADLWSLGGLLYASVEGCPPYDKGSAIATLTAVMTEPLDPPKSAGPLEEVIYGLLAKDPDQRLDDAGARALLTAVVYAPETPERPEPPRDATRAMALPPIPPPAAPKAKSAPPAAGRGRGAPRSAGSAGPAPAAVPQSASRPPQRAEPPAPPVQRAAPVRAPLTDVVPRRTLVIAAVVVVLAVLATVLYLTLGDDEEKNGAKSGADVTASAGAESSADTGSSAGSETTPDGESGKPAESGTAGSGEKTGQDGADRGDGGKDGKDGDQSDSSSSSSSSAGESGGKGVPDGYGKISNGRFRFAMAMPENFSMTGVAGQNSGGIFSESGGFPRVQVDFTATPGDDAAAAWQASVPGTRAQSDGYQHRSIKTIEYKGYPTVADWEFERNQKGQRIRVLNRGFKVDAQHGYAIMVSCKASEWDESECKTLRRTAFATFKPKG
ncbi:serine/threonine-protein kinase [Streptomyces jumonjinensis]|uniref:serine/threonine-protein kinase n=1 Tax=Streptomyces jumonjinensis TaxID=1945 RepID=UPI0037A7DA67